MCFACGAEMINKYRGKYPALPATMDNPLWRQVSWWIEWNDFLTDRGGKEPASLDDYVAWSQGRQATGLCLALQASKSRFPACGGFIIWMGHDSLPVPGQDLAHRFRRPSETRSHRGEQDMEGGRTEPGQGSHSQFDNSIPVLRRLQKTRLWFASWRDMMVPRIQQVYAKSKTVARWPRLSRVVVASAVQALYIEVRCGTMTRNTRKRNGTR